MASPQGSDSALRARRRGVLWSFCVCVHECEGVCVYMCVQEGTGVEREERHRQARRDAGTRVSRKENSGRGLV